jgi:thiol-disulfide isomerase/thioredoxin
MFKRFFIGLLLLSFTAQAQIEIKGTFTPIDESDTWVVLYQLKGSKQYYLGNSAIENGTFQFDLPQSAEKGMYRINYRLDGNGTVDFIFSGAPIELQFDPNNPYKTLTFLNSQENQVYFSYKNKAEILKNKLDSLQINYFRIDDENERVFTENLYKSALKYYKNVQKSYDSITVNKLSNKYIKANQKYYADSIISNPQQFLNSEKEHFFDFVDFESEAFLNSAVLGEMVIGYVFYLNQSDDAQVQTALFKNAVNTILGKVKGDSEVSKEIQSLLLNSFSRVENANMVDYVLENYYYKLPKVLQNKKFVDEVLNSVKLAFGRTAPNFSWKNGATTMNLSEFNKEGITILAFWSSDCSHCLTEIPQLYDFIIEYSDVKVVAYALEEYEDNFKVYAEKFNEWTNVLGLNKWENDVAQEYQIVATPTYFILNKDKKIIAKPDFFVEIKSFFEN